MSIIHKTSYDFKSNQEEEDYKEMVDFYMKTNEEIPSIGSSQSSIVLTKFIEKTNKKILILLSSFSGEVSDNEDYFNAMKDCLNRDVAVTVLFIDKPNKKSAIYELLLNRVGSTVEMHQCNVAAKDFLLKKFSEKNYSTICHFSIFDDKMFRKEIDTDNFISIANSNDVNEAQDLSRIFFEAISLLDHN